MRPASTYAFVLGSSNPIRKDVPVESADAGRPTRPPPLTSSSRLVQHRVAIPGAARPAAHWPRDTAQGAVRFADELAATARERYDQSACCHPGCSHPALR